MTPETSTEDESEEEGGYLLRKRSIHSTPTTPPKLPTTETDYSAYDYELDPTKDSQVIRFDLQNIVVDYDKPKASYALQVGTCSGAIGRHSFEIDPKKNNVKNSNAPSLAISGEFSEKAGYFIQLGTLYSINHILWLIC
jgi:hypothetical protein